jgi:hypothetical protein
MATLGLVAVAGGGFYGIWRTSGAFADSGIAVNFVVVNTLSLLVFLAIVAQACIYWSQRGLMKKQWEAMQNTLMVTQHSADMATGQLVAMQSQERALYQQLEVIKEQSLTMKSSVEAMKWQGGIMEIQTDLSGKQVSAMQGQLELMKSQMAHSAVRTRAYLGIKGVGIVNPIVNQTIVIFANLFNGGQTPAWSVEQKFQVGLVEGPPRPFNWFAEANQVSDAGLTSTFFPAGAEKRITFPEILNVTEEAFAEFEGGKRTIYVDGEIRFTDHIGSKQVFAFGMLSTARDNGQFRERYQHQHDEDPN